MNEPTDSTEPDLEDLEEELDETATETDAEEENDEADEDDSNSESETSQTSSTATQTSGHVGIDIGTENLVVASQEEDGSIGIGHQRNAFIEVPGGDEFTRKMINNRGLSHAERDGNLYVLGDEAFELARILNKDPQRPMDRGVLSPDETDAIPIISMFLEELVGKAKGNSKAVFSIPADPIDTDFDAAFHESIFNEMLGDLGYETSSIYEGHAAVLAELEDNNFTGIAASFGAGMTNCCIAFESIPAVVLATSRGGRWIDERASKVAGVKQSKVTGTKEDGVNLLDPDGRIEKAISIYYRELLTWTLENIAKKFKESQDVPEFTDPVPLVATGGTASAEGFADLFLDVYEEIGFPIEIRDFRVAEDPLNSVCKGALVHAQL